MPDLTFTPTDFQPPVASTPIENISGKFKRVTAIPTISPTGFWDRIALDTTTDAIYYWDDTQWRTAGAGTSLSTDIMDALNGANGPDAGNVFATTDDLAAAGSSISTTGTVGDITVSTGNAVAMGFYQSDGGVQFDNGSSGNANASGGSFTGGVAAGSNSNRILIAVVQRSATGAPSCTYNGVPMTNVFGSLTPGGGSVHSINVFVLLAPATGTNNLIITGLSGAENFDLATYAYYGVKQTSNPSLTAQNVSVSSQASISASITPATNGARIFTVIQTLGNNTPTYANMSGNQNVNTSLAGGAAGRLTTGDSLKIGPAQLMTMSGTQPSTDWAMATLSIEPFTAAVPAVFPTTSDNSTVWNKNYRATAFMGFASSGGPTGNTITIITQGVVTGLSGLLYGEQYYLASSIGAISRTPVTNTRKVGIALSSTALLITNQW